MKTTKKTTKAKKIVADKKKLKLKSGLKAGARIE
jgi:hypothetical protein